MLALSVTSEREGRPQAVGSENYVPFKLHLGLSTKEPGHGAYRKEGESGMPMPKGAPKLHFSPVGGSFSMGQASGVGHRSLPDKRYRASQGTFPRPHPLRCCVASQCSMESGRARLERLLRRAPRGETTSPRRCSTWGLSPRLSKVGQNLVPLPVARMSPCWPPPDLPGPSDGAPRPSMKSFHAKPPESRSITKVPVMICLVPLLEEGAPSRLRVRRCLSVLDTREGRARGRSPVGSWVRKGRVSVTLALAET
jgi:hypothetical protein